MDRRVSWNQLVRMLSYFQTTPLLADCSTLIYHLTIPVDIVLGSTSALSVINNATIPLPRTALYPYKLLDINCNML